MKLFAAYVEISVGVAILAESPSTSFRLHDLWRNVVWPPATRRWVDSSYRFCDLLESLIFILLEDVVPVQVEQFELPLDDLMIADVAESRSRFRMFSVENVRQRGVERHAIIWRALLARCTVARHWRSLLIRLSSAVRSTVFCVRLLNRFTLRIDAPAAVVFQTLNRRVRSVLATFRNELDLRSLGERVSPRC